MGKTDTPEWKAAIAEIDAVVRKHADILQPLKDDDENRECDCFPEGPMLLSGFTLVCAWMDTDNDEWLTRTSEPKISRSHLAGQLFVMLQQH